MIKKQLLASLSSLLGNACAGMTTTFTSTLLPQIHLNDDLNSWLAGTDMLSQLFGIVVGSFLMRMYGRKPFIMWLNVPWLIGWICLSFADTFWMFLVGCFVVGTVAGFYGNLATIYIIEMPEPRYRGYFAALNSITFAFGILLENLIGVVFQWQTTLRITSVVPVLSFLFAFYTPESPNWLILHQRFDKAKENFLWLRSASPENSQEFDQLLGTSDEDEPSDISLSRHLFAKPFLKSVFIASLAVTCDNVAGFDTITAYSAQIMQRMSPDVDTKWAPVLMWSVAVMSCAVSCVIIEKFARRVLFFASGLGILLSLLAMVTIMACSLPDYLLIIFLCSYQAAGYLGVLSIPWLLTGEIFPDITREVGSGLSNVFYYTMGFISVKTYPLLINTIGMNMIYVVYSCLLFIWLTVLYFVMPETKGYVLQRTEFRPERRDRHEQLITN